MLSNNLSHDEKLQRLVEGLNICLKHKDDMGLSKELRKQCEEQAKFYLNNIVKLEEGK